MATLWVTGICCILIGDMVTWVYASVKTHQIVHLRSMHLTVYGIYLNKKQKPVAMGWGEGK